MYIRYGTATVTSTTFTSNTAGGGGGAMYIGGDSTDVTLRQCSFTSTQHRMEGHSIYTSTLICRHQHAYSYY